MGKELKVAAYCRVSTDRDDQNNSLVSQRIYFARYIHAQENWTLSQIYYDEGISGTQTRRRAGFTSMIEDACHGKIDLILTKEVSRFARNTVDTLFYTRKLKEMGVGVVFTIDNIDTRDSDGELRLTLMASIAQEESRKTSERVKWGQKRRMEQGVVFGRDLLGYKVENGRLLINEEEAAMVRAIFHKYTNEGKGTHVIARELLEEGMRPQRARLWSNVVILRVLKNEKYVGDLCQKKTITPDYLTHVRKCNTGEEEMVCIKDHHEPIIDRSLWERTQKELKERSGAGEEKGKYKNRYWCSGKIFCGVCGKSYVSRCKHLKSGRRYLGWRCYGTANHDTGKQDKHGQQKGCKNLQINNETLLFSVKFCIQCLQWNRDNLKREVLRELRELKKLPEDRTDTRKLQKEAEHIRRKRKKALDLLLEGVITEEAFKEQNIWYEEELNVLERKLEQAREGEKSCEKQADRRNGYETAVQEILDFQMANEYLCGEVLEKISIYPEHILDIWLKGIPAGFRLTFWTHGRGDGFCVEITEICNLCHQRMV